MARSQGNERTTCLRRRRVGLEIVPYQAIPGADAATNAPLFLDLLHGEAHPYIEGLVCLSSALLLRTTGTVGSIPAGLELARELLRSGLVRVKFEQFRRAALRLGQC